MIKLFDLHFGDFVDFDRWLSLLLLSTPTTTVKVTLIECWYIKIKKRHLDAKNHHTTPQTRKFFKSFQSLLTWFRKWRLGCDMAGTRMTCVAHKRYNDQKTALWSFRFFNRSKIIKNWNDQDKLARNRLKSSHFLSCLYPPKLQISSRFLMSLRWVSQVFDELSLRFFE